jgi:L-aspartate oxidase
VHGANRLASNSLLEAIVFAHRAAERIGPQLSVMRMLEPESYPASATAEPDAEALLRTRDEIRNLMWDLVGIVRSDERLNQAQTQVRRLAEYVNDLWATSRPTPDSIEVRNLIQTALMVVRCAILRKESRGLHYTVDHPHRDNERWLRDTIVVR